MSVTLLDIGSHGTATYYQGPDSVGPESWRIGSISSREMTFTLDFEGQTYTLWMQGQFQENQIPEGALTLADLPDPAPSDLFSGVGIDGVFAISVDPSIGYDTLTHFMSPHSNLDYAYFLSGDDNYITDSGAVYSEAFYLYDGNDIFFQNHHLLQWPDNFYGGDGLDTVSLPSHRSNYQVQASDSVWDDLHSASNLPGFYITDATGNINTTGVNEVERIEFADGNVALDVGHGDNAGMAYRIYKAAFDRTPDEEGLGFWIYALDLGYSLEQVGNVVMTSPEFQQVYGINSSNRTFVDLLYQHVLHRAADEEGFNFWNSALNAGYSRGAVLAVYTECPETIALTADLIANGIQYQAWGA